MGFFLLILGLALFIGAHVFVTMRPQRDAAIKQIGDGAYKILFALVAIAGVVLISWGYGLYRETEWIEVWDPPSWTRHVTVLLTWPAVICVTASAETMRTPSRSPPPKIAW